MNKKIIFTISFAFLIGLILTACGNTTNSNNEVNNQFENQVTDEKEPANNNNT